MADFKTSECNIKKSQKNCNFCASNTASYSCPKCHAPYCSINCYKSQIHSECTESFYQQQVYEELSSNIDFKSRKEMLMLLIENLIEENCGDEFRESEGKLLPGLEERLEGLDLEKCDANLIWQNLTESERNEFHANMDKLVKPYRPWWSTNNTLVKDESVSWKVAFPMFIKNSPPFREIYAGIPSPNLKYDVINIIYSYIIIHRLYNGELSDDILEEFLEEMINISLVLQGRGTFEDVGTALVNVQLLASSMDNASFSFQDLTEIYHPVIEIIKGKNVENGQSFVSYCFSHIYSMLEICLKKYKLDSLGNCEIKKKFYLVQKKIYFLFVWSLENINNLINLCDLIEAEYQIKKAEKEDYQAQFKMNNKIKLKEDKNTNKVLIEEIS